MEVITIKNKKTEIDNLKEDKMSYADIAIICLNQVPSTGFFDVTTMSARLEVVDLLKESKSEIKVSENQYQIMIDCVDEMKWIKIDKDIVSFVADIKAAKK